MKEILVTGGAGFIGSNFVKYWLENYPGSHIVNLDALTYAGYPKNLEEIYKKWSGQHTFVKGNIENIDLVSLLLKEHNPQAIINFAAESDNSRAVLNPTVFYKTNVLGTQHLLEAARLHGVERFHHVSTCEVYGDLALDTDEKFTEESSYKPRTPYNSSKAGADMAVRAYYETFALPITISICSNNYGPNQFPEKLIPLFVVKALKGGKLPLYKHSQNRREWLHVKDHCKAIDDILHKGNVGETYNVGSGIEADVETIADTILDYFNLDQTMKKYVEDRPGHDRRYLLDSTKIHNQLGWKPQIEFQKGIRETIRWYEKNREWWEPLLARLLVQEEIWGE